MINALQAVRLSLMLCVGQIFVEDACFFRFFLNDRDTEVTGICGK